MNLLEDSSTTKYNINGGNVMEGMKMKGRTQHIIALLLVACLMLASVAGCSSNSKESNKSSAATTKSEVKNETKSEVSNETSAAPTEPIKVGATFPTLQVEFFAALKKKLEILGPRYNIEFEIVSAESDTTLQSQQIDNFVTMGKDYIVCIGIGGTGAVDAMISAQKAGVPVINLLNDIDDFPAAFEVSILMDAFLRGQRVAEMASAWIDETYPDAADGSVKVAVLSNRMNIDAVNITDGMYEIFNINPKTVLVGDYQFAPGDDFAAKSQEYGDIIFASDPDVAVVLAYACSYATSFDPVVYRQPNLDYSRFAIFTSDWTDQLADSVIASRTDKSVVRGTVAAWVNTERAIISYILGDGEYEVDENRHIMIESIPVGTDYVDEFKELTKID